ncbi:MAG: ABC transporter transmembrane domain-containing protein [Rhodospirillaceae bacterium]
MAPRPTRTAEADGFLHYRDLGPNGVPRAPFSFLAALIRHHPFGFLSLIATAVGGLGVYSLEPMLLRDMVEALRTAPRSGATEAATQPFLLVVSAWLVSAGFNRLHECASMHTVPTVKLEIQSILFSWLVEHSPQFFNETFAGDIAQRVKQVSSAAASLISVLFHEGVRLFVALGIGVVLLSGFPPVFTWLLLGWASGFMLASALCARSCQRLSRANSEATSHSTGTLVDIVANMASVRSFARRAEECRRFGTSLVEERDVNIALRRFMVVNFLVL